MSKKLRILGIFLILLLSVCKPAIDQISATPSPTLLNTQSNKFTSTPYITEQSKSTFHQSIPTSDQNEEKSPSRIEFITLETPWDGLSRNIRIYLPAGYDNSDINYPVLYWSDGQAYVGKVEVDFIMVGIDSDLISRWDELSPWINQEMPLWFGISSPRGGLGEDFLQFILDVKKVVDANYRTKLGRDYTGIAGGSMGGFFAIYAGMEKQNIFSKVIAFSPAVWFGSRDIYHWLEENNLIDYILIHDSRKEDFWIYIGGNEFHDDGYPKVGECFQIDYFKGAAKVNSIVGGTFVYDLDGLHKTTVFREHYDEMLAWLGW